MIRRCFFPFVVTLPFSPASHSSNVRDSASVCLNPAAWFLQGGEATRVLTTSRGTLVLDHFPRIPHSSHCLARQVLHCDGDAGNSLSATCIRFGCTIQHHPLPEEQKWLQATCMDPGSSRSGKGGIQHTKSNFGLSTRLAAKTSDQHTLQRQHTTNHDSQK